MLDISVQTEAEQLLEDLGFNQLPISLDDICDSISQEYFIDIQERDMQFENFNGMSVGDQTQTKILINSNIDNIHRRRFTKAHELGHVVLHIQTGKQSEFKRTSKNISSNDGNNDQFEKEANMFASSLLMPSFLILKDIHKNDLSWKLIQNIKEACNVSLEAAARRVVYLSKESCCLIIHKNKKMWSPVSSPSFRIFVEKQPFPDNLDYEDDSENQIFSGSMEECDFSDWQFLKNEQRVLSYTSIYNKQYDKQMTLILCEE
jgi:Zn-dependent peptidase ImmA (M78 family)